MDRKPRRRRLTWFGNDRPGTPPPTYPPLYGPQSKPNTLGAMWRQEPPDRGTTDSWLIGEPPQPGASSPRQSGLEPLSNLPALPPMLEDNGLGKRRANFDRYDRLAADSSTDDPAPPRWSQSDADARPERPRNGRLSALWGTLVTTRLRQPRLALAAGAVLLCLVLGAVALGNAFLQGGPGGSRAGQSAVRAGSASGAASPSAGKGAAGATTTPRVSPTTGASVATSAATKATPANTPPPAPLTIAFTCASGVAGGTGQVCVRTLPQAALTLTVRYCDGTYAKGKAFHGAASADSGGNYTWTWNVTTTCIGAATATVTAKSAGQTVTNTTTFAVTR